MISMVPLNITGFFVKAGKQCDTENGAWHDIRDHGDDIHRAGERVLSADHQIGDHDRQKYNDDEGAEGL